MIMKKETLVFITSLAIIFIIGYVNMTMKPENVFNEDDYSQFQSEEQNELAENDVAEILEGDPAATAEALPEESENAAAQEESTDVTETDYEILGDITDITDLNTVEASSTAVIDTLNSCFENFKLNKEKGNMDVLDHLEENISNALISEDTKSQFEALLLNKNSFIEAEKDIELMLQTKGYNETVVIVDEDMVKVITNETIEQADATKILDVIVSETDYEPIQIKIVKFDNIDL
ncbi:MAG: SpoIIIAH-like family protein [Sedimentibacter sp.]|uniref:SpoIIIAH-like family protein n=1 Tax=Sedimentibacter sp. TaxID=1960295 RepID=UPI0029821CC0|nr:SpoIIIAH-like family protein [Sedimentibacter sp.]MDW5300325.1 SpoIIIAH-like family protein [Sedimentibacter sp.]